MYLETKEIKEYHANGMLAYSENRTYITEASCGLYSNRIGNPPFIRTGIQQKKHDNGLLEWSLEYDNMGNVIKHNKGYQKDGTPRTY